jgi:uncharacterized protein
MAEFKALDFDDRDVFLNYLKEYNFNTYEYSFFNLYLWRKLCNVEYTTINDALIVKKTEKNRGPYFMQPIGYSKENLEKIILDLNMIKRDNPKMNCLFRDVEEPFLQELKDRFGDRITYYEDENNFDYIYESRKLASLPGNKFRRKKNQYNQFVKNYNFTIKDIADEKVIEDCINFALSWKETKEELSEELFYEIEGIQEVLRNMKLLSGVGMAVYVDEKIAGFTVGEKVNKDMAIVHIEKGDINYKGVYAFINKTFAENYLHDVEFVNREEDLGLEGLRKAKQAYNPIKFEKKYVVDLI